MAWVEVTLRGQQVLAKAAADGSLVDNGGRVEIRYKPNDGRSYRAAAVNLSPVPGGRVFPDDHCGEAVSPPPPGKKRAAAPPGRPPKPAATSGGGANVAPAATATAAATAATAAGSRSIIVYADGACSGNPGPAGCGFVVVDPKTGALLEGYEYLGIGTNNIAELTAILRGVEVVSDLAAPIRVHTDSSYAIGVLQKGWKAKANPELIAKIRAELARRPRVTLVYVPGHAGVPLNERADELAREAVRTRGSRGIAPLA